MQARFIYNETWTLESYRAVFFFFYLKSVFWFYYAAQVKNVIFLIIKVGSLGWAVRSAPTAKVCDFIEEFDSAHNIAVDLKHTYGNMFDLFIYNESLQLFVALKIEKFAKECRFMTEMFVTRKCTSASKTGLAYIRGVKTPSDGAILIRNNEVSGEVLDSGV